MILKFYKPNSKNTGCAFGFQLSNPAKAKGPKEPVVFLSAIQQFSWNDKIKNGSFSENAKNPEKSISIKLNELELGGLINAIENYTEFSAFHSYEDNKTAISFKPYTKGNGTKAFSFSLSRNSANKFGIGVELSEAYALRAFCQFSLNEIFGTRYTSNEN